VEALGLALKSGTESTLRAFKLNVDPPSSLSEAAWSVYGWIVGYVQIDHPGWRVRALLHRFHCADQLTGYGRLLFGA
jgi:hypothetical protein